MGDRLSAIIPDSVVGYAASRTATVPILRTLKDDYTVLSTTSESSGSIGGVFGGESRPARVEGNGAYSGAGAGRRAGRSTVNRSGSSSRKFRRPGDGIGEGSNRSASAKSRARIGETNRSIDSDIQQADVLVAIPAYNEERSISDVVKNTRRHADSVLVIDDGSEDSTAKRAIEAGAIVVDHGENEGYGATLKTAFEQADRLEVDTLIVLDGDGQHDAEDIPSLLHAQTESNAEIIIGSRVLGRAENIPRYRRFGLAMINLLVRLSFLLSDAGFRVRDSQSGFRAYDRVAVRTLAEDKSISDDMSASIDILYHAHRHGYDVKEVATTIQYGNDSNTHGSVSHGLQLVKRILRQVGRTHPFAALTTPCVVCAVFGVALEYWKTRRSVDGRR